NKFHETLPPTFALEDLVSTGIIGLIEAVENFDPRFNTKLGTYAHHRIRGAILDSVRGSDGVSGPKRQRMKQVEKAVAGLEQRLQRAPSEEEIAAELNLTTEEYGRLLLELRAVKLTSFEHAQDGSGGLLAYLAAGEENHPNQSLERSELERVLEEGIQKLPERERQVLSLYYKEELTLREIGTVMGLHLTRISQLKAQGILRLKAYLERYWPTRSGARP
ncbi:MAG: FliA/WhiG family RNA polymerase sigma factor, partial [Acidobacteria bacterium]|nr:FliA/WhiG family RNA polymerase sigma factor [Acidobacteriota bacterium]